MDISDTLELAQVFNASNDLLAILDLDRRIRNINNAYLNFLGLTKKHVIGRSCRKLLQSEL
ncbi:MAG: PAS domain S-box protein [Desulfobacteraceae bacterium]